MIGSNIVSWSAKRQPTVSRSSTEAEYRTLASTASELTWLSFILRDMKITQPKPAILRCDNLSAVHLTANPVLHSRSKHFETDYHYVRERVALGVLEVQHVPSAMQLADIFTKSLPRQSFQSLRAKLNVGKPPTISLRGDESISHMMGLDQSSHDPMNEERRMLAHQQSLRQGSGKTVLHTEQNKKTNTIAGVSCGIAISSRYDVLRAVESV